MDYTADVFIVAFLFLLILLLILPAVAWILGLTKRRLAVWSSKRQLISSNIIYAQYEPPDGLRPADIAYLYDQKIGANEVLATLFDLEQRNILKLTRSTNSFAEGKDFHITLLKSPQDKTLNEFEQELVVAVQSLGRKSTWSALRSIDTIMWESRFEHIMDKRLHDLGYFTRRNWLANNTTFRVFCSVLIAGLVSFMPVFTSVIDLSGEALDSVDPSFDQLGRDIAIFALLCTWVICSFVTYFFMVPIFGAYARGSKLQSASQKLHDLWPAIEGFRQFVSIVELDRIGFENAKQKELARHAVLPYAVALNLATDWESRFT